MKDQGRLVRIVAVREMNERLHNRTFVLGTLLMVGLLAAFLIVPSLFADGRSDVTLAVVGDFDPELTDALVSMASLIEVDLTIRPVDDEPAGVALLDDGEAAAVLDGDRLLVPDSVLDTHTAALRAMVDQARQQTAVLLALSDRGIAPGEAAEILRAVPPVTIVTPDGDEGPDEAALALAFISTILLFLILQINGSTLLNGAIEEKSSRVVEVLLGTVRPWQLLAGKLLALSILAFGQLALFVAVTLGANAAVGAFELPATTGSALLVGMIMLLFGFAFYAALYAVAGAMTSSVEDAQAAAGPLTFVTIGAYVGTLLGVVQNPDGVVAQLLTWFPPTAPFAVPARVAIGGLGLGEVIAVSLLLAVTTSATIRLAGRLYSAAVLAGGRLTWREVFRAEPVGW